MPERLAIAYALIALLGIAVILAVVLYGRKRRQERGKRRGNSWLDL